MNFNILEIIKKTIFRTWSKIAWTAKQEKLLIFKGYRDKKFVTSNGIIRF